MLFYFHNFVFCENSIRTGVAKLKLDSKNDQKNYDVLHPLTFTFPCLNILSKFTDDEMFDENRQINKHSLRLHKHNFKRTGKIQLRNKNRQKQVVVMKVV